MCIERLYNTTYNTRPCVQLYNCACCRLQLVAISCRLRSAQPALNCQSAVGTILLPAPSSIMGPKKDAVWDEFHEPYVPDGSKVVKVVCRNCSEVVGATAARLRSHISACSKRARSIGQLNLGFTTPPRKKTKTATSSSGDPSTAKATEHNGNITASSSTFSNGRAHFDYLTRKENERLCKMFAHAIHQTAMSFKAFEHHTWQEFFHALRGAFHIPSTEMIGSDLLRMEYTNIIAEIVRNLKQFVMICLTLDGATNVQGKQIINKMACGPMAFFLEHFSMELRRESAENLYEKLIDCKRRLLLTIRELAPGFVSHVVSSDAGDDDADPQQVATLNEHFVGASMFTFCSDSPSVKLRRLCIQDTEFLFAFGCSSHALHNLCMDLVKEFSVVKLIVKQIIFLVKSVRKTHLIQQLFDKICARAHPFHENALGNGPRRRQAPESGADGDVPAADRNHVERPRR